MTYKFVMARPMALFLFLLVLAFPAIAMPVAAGTSHARHAAAATAPCHAPDAGAAQSHKSGHDSAPEQDRAPNDKLPVTVGAHGCIGCLVLAEKPPVALPVYRAAAMHVPLPFRPLAGLTDLPATPPPRS